MANILYSFKEDSSYRPVNMNTETEKLNINLESSLEEARTDEDDNKDMIFSILLFLLAIVVLVDNILTHKFYSSKLNCRSANKCTNLELEDDNAVKASQIGDINIGNKNKARDEVKKEDRTGANNTNIDEQNNVSKVSEIHVKDMKNIDEEEGGVLKNNETSNVDEVKKEDNVETSDNDNDSKDSADKSKKKDDSNKSFLSRISRILSPHKSSTSSSSLERANAKVANIKKNKNVWFRIRDRSANDYD